MKVKCDACRGHKRVVGLGMIEIECDKCDGYGKIDESELDVIPPQISLEHYISPNVRPAAELKAEELNKSNEELGIPGSTPLVTPTAAKKAAKEAR